MTQLWPPRPTLNGQFEKLYLVRISASNLFFLYLDMKLHIENFIADVKGVLHDDMSDEEFFNFCQQNPDLRIERDSNNQIFIMAPTGLYTGSNNPGINSELYVWNKKSKAGQVFDSSTGFTLPDGAIFSPDDSWISNERIKEPTDEEKKKFAPLCPDFIIELKSPSDNLKQLKIRC